MGLSDITIPTKTIKTPGGDFDVRGLSYTDISSLAQDYFPQMLALFSQVAKSAAEDEANEENIGLMIKTALDTAPQMICAAIALAADEPELASVVSKLTVLSQTEAVLAVVELTLVGEAELEKFIETVTMSLEGLSGALSKVTIPDSVNGFGESEAT